MSRRSNRKLALTRRALSDIQSIADYSTTQWGNTTAQRYLDDLEAALGRAKEHPELLQGNPDFHPALLFYRVNQHLLVLDVLADSMVVLAVLHASMNIPQQLAQLEPNLVAEVKVLHNRLRSTKPNDR